MGVRLGDAPERSRLAGAIGAVEHFAEEDVPAVARGFTQGTHRFSSDGFAVVVEHRFERIPGDVHPLRPKYFERP